MAKRPNPEMEGSPAEEAAESPKVEAAEQASMTDHPVVHRPHNPPYPA